MIYILVIIIVLILIIRNQSIIYHYLISFPRLYSWLNKEDRKQKLESIRNKLTSYLNYNDYFDSLLDNKIHHYFTPIFDNSLFLKKEVENIFDKDITSKEDSLPYIINLFTTPYTLFGNWIGNSIFRTDYYNRGNNNRYKEIYMEALKVRDLKEYRKIIKEKIDYVFKTNIETNLFDLSNQPYGIIAGDEYGLPLGCIDLGDDLLSHWNYQAPNSFTRQSGFNTETIEYSTDYAQTIRNHTYKLSFEFRLGNYQIPEGTQIEFQHGIDMDDRATSTFFQLSYEDLINLPDLFSFTNFEASYTAQSDEQSILLIKAPQSSNHFFRFGNDWKYSEITLLASCIENSEPESFVTCHEILAGPAPYIIPNVTAFAC